MSALEIATTLLRQHAGVIGFTTADRVYGGEAEQGAPPPFVVVNLVAETDGQLLEGAAVYPESRIQVECVGATMASADALGEAVKAALQSVVKATVGSAADVDVRKDGVDFTEPAADQFFARRVIGFYIRWR